MKQSQPCNTAKIFDEYNWALTASDAELRTLVGKPLYEICGNEVCACTYAQNFLRTENGVFIEDDEGCRALIGRSVFIDKTNAFRVLYAMSPSTSGIIKEDDLPA